MGADSKAKASPPPSKPWSLGLILTGNRPQVIFPVYAIWAITTGYLCQLTLPWYIWAFTLGLVWETWLEFSIHRWVLHFPLFIPKSLKSLEKHYYVVHGHHHMHPERRPFFPLPHSQVMMVGSYLLFTYLFSRDFALGMCAGGATGLIFFELVHNYIHQGIGLWWLKPMETYHLYHHSKTKKVAYGFVTPAWDYYFGATPAQFDYPIIPIPLPVIPFIISAFMARQAGKDPMAPVQVDVGHDGYGVTHKHE